MQETISQREKWKGLEMFICSKFLTWNQLWLNSHGPRPVSAMYTFFLRADFGDYIKSNHKQSWEGNLFTHTHTPAGYPQVHPIHTPYSTSLKGQQSRFSGTNFNQMLWNRVTPSSPFSTLAISQTIRPAGLRINIKTSLVAWHTFSAHL